jgi:hypothetical protein
LSPTANSMDHSFSLPGSRASCGWRRASGKSTIRDCLQIIGDGAWPNSSLVPALPPLLFRTALSFTTLRLAQRDTPLLTTRQEKAILLDITQDTFTLYLFAKAFEQLLLRLTRSQCDSSQLNSPPSILVWQRRRYIQPLGPSSAGCFDSSLKV